MRRQGALDTVRPGAYVAGSVGEDAAAERHLFAVHAAVAQLGAGTVISHTSAALMHGLPLWRAPLDRVHATRDRRSGARRNSLVHLHAAALEPDEVTSVGGVLVTSVARTMVDVARLLPFGNALVPADAALHRRLTTVDELDEAVVRGAHRRRNSAARRVVAFADGRSESPGETLRRVAIHDAGLPVPVLQREVRSGDGRLLGRCDFYWEEFAVVGEFDGRVKYGRGLRHGQDPGDKLRAERFGMVRWTWADLTRFAPVADRIRRSRPAR